MNQMFLIHGEKAHSGLCNLSDVSDLNTMVTYFTIVNYFPKQRPPDVCVGLALPRAVTL